MWGEDCACVSVWVGGGLCVCKCGVCVRGEGY